MLYCLILKSNWFATCIIQIQPRFLSSHQFTMSESKDQITVQASGVDRDISTSSLAKDSQMGAQRSSSQAEASEHPVQPADLVDQKKGFFGYFKTKEFYITVVLG